MIPTQDTPRSIIAGPTGCSASIASLTAALAKAQGAIQGASKDRLNPHFKQPYADLASIWAACRDPLSVNNLAVLQLTSSEGQSVTVATILAHSSGEWVQSELTMQAQTASPQAIGSCITYARRYALAAMVGVAPEDDDGHEASAGGESRISTTEPSFTRGPAFEPTREPSGFKTQWSKLEEAADVGSEAFKGVWDRVSPEVKNFIMAERKDERAALVARAKGKP